MNIENLVMAAAGGLIFISVILSVVHSESWLIFTGFVGLNLFQAAFTGFCPLAVVLKKMGMKSGSVFH